MSDIQGKRIFETDHEALDNLNPGEYMLFHNNVTGTKSWFARCPKDRPDGWSILATLAAHDVIEHEDGAITVSPSIGVGIPGQPFDYHGFLEHGIWREC